MLFFVPASALAAFDRDLSYGSKGEDVKELQEFLTTEGVYDFDVTGNFYSITRKAVKDFQSQHGLNTDGAFKGQTRLKAIELLGEESPTEAVDPILAKLMLESQNMALYGNPWGPVTPVVVVNQEPIVVVQETPAASFQSTPVQQPQAPALTITKFEAEPAVRKPGEDFKFFWESNAKTCTIVSDRTSVTIPFLGLLPNSWSTGGVPGTYTLVCADKDWNTVTRDLTIETMPVTFSQEPFVENYEGGPSHYRIKLGWTANLPLTLVETTDVNYAWTAGEARTIPLYFLDEDCKALGSPKSCWIEKSITFTPPR